MHGKSDKIGKHGSPGVIPFIRIQVIYKYGDSCVSLRVKLNKLDRLDKKGSFPVVASVAHFESHTD